MHYVSNALQSKFIQDTQSSRTYKAAAKTPQSTPRNESEIFLNCRKQRWGIRGAEHPGCLMTLDHIHPRCKSVHLVQLSWAWNLVTKRGNGENVPISCLCNSHPPSSTRQLEGSLGVLWARQAHGFLRSAPMYRAWRAAFTTTTREGWSRLYDVVLLCIFALGVLITQSRV